MRADKRIRKRYIVGLVRVPPKKPCLLGFREYGLKNPTLAPRHTRHGLRIENPDRVDWFAKALRQRGIMLPVPHDNFGFYRPGSWEGTGSIFEICRETRGEKSAGCTHWRVW